MTSPAGTVVRTEPQKAHLILYERHMRLSAHFDSDIGGVNRVDRRPRRLQIRCRVEEAPVSLVSGDSRSHG